MSTVPTLLLQRPDNGKPAGPGRRTTASDMARRGLALRRTALKRALVEVAEPAPPAPADHEMDAHALTACSAKLEELVRSVLLDSASPA